jgi:hypothetical protein
LDPAGLNRLDQRCVVLLRLVRIGNGEGA